MSVGKNVVIFGVHADVCSYGKDRGGVYGVRTRRRTSGVNAVSGHAWETVVPHAGMLRDAVVYVGMQMRRIRSR